MDLTQFVAAGGIVGLFAASSLVLFRAMTYESGISTRLQNQINDQQEQIDSVKAENIKCAKANHVLILTLQKHGIEVPSEGWL